MKWEGFQLDSCPFQGKPDHLPVFIKICCQGIGYCLAAGHLPPVPKPQGVGYRVVLDLKRDSLKVPFLLNPSPNRSIVGFRAK